MIVYVESNFVLELALRQQEYEFCERLLRRAEANRVQLVVPAYSLAEPYQTWHRRAREREGLRRDLEGQLRQLSRSEPYGEVLEESTRITGLLTRSIDEDKKRIDGLCRRLLTVATVVKLDGATVSASLDLQASRDLSPQDALVYASVIAHVRSSDPNEPKVFVTRDPDDFLTPEIEEDLSEYGARIVPTFADSVGFIDATLDPSN